MDIFQTKSSRAVSWQEKLRIHVCIGQRGLYSIELSEMPVTHHLKLTRTISYFELKILQSKTINLPTKWGVLWEFRFVHHCSYTVGVVWHNRKLELVSLEFINSHVFFRVIFQGIDIKISPWAKDVDTIQCNAIHTGLLGKYNYNYTVAL